MLNDKKVFDYWNISNQEFIDIFDEIIDNQKRLSLEEKKSQIIVNIFYIILNLYRKL